MTGRTLPDGWTLAASTFNWMPDVLRAERPAADVVAAIAGEGVATTVEIELGQVLRSFPDPEPAEVDALREALGRAGGRVGVVGASVDDFAASGERRPDGERLAFLVPQLHAAHRLGALGVRLPIGQAGRPLLERLLPLLHELGLTLFEEIQGQQVPTDPAVVPAVDAIGELDDDRVRLLVDISMLMPALPPSYLERLAASGVPADLVARLTHDWRSPTTADAVVALLRDGAVPPRIHTLYMDLVVRFGRSDAAALRGVLPLLGAVHLKFWDLDDTDGRVSRPIADLAGLLRGAGFRGTLASEWGGHEWLDGVDATDCTRRHLAMAASALAAGADPREEVPGAVPVGAAQ